MLKCNYTTNHRFRIQGDVSLNKLRIVQYLLCILLLNNDTEVITSDWIEAMVEQAQRPTIGVIVFSSRLPHLKCQKLNYSR